jgi:Pet100
MAKGRQGLMLEGWKFGVYLLVPIIASVYYSEPKRQKEAADYWQYVRYPANPNVGMKQKIEDLAAQQKQRDAYRDQMKLLAEQAAKSVQKEKQQRLINSEENKTTPTNGWLRWIGLGRRVD